MQALPDALSVLVFLCLASVPTSAQDQKKIPPIQEQDGSYILNSSEIPIEQLRLLDLVNPCRETTGYDFTYDPQTGTALAGAKVVMQGTKRIPKSEFFDFFQIQLFINEFACLEVGPPQNKVILIQSIGQGAANRGGEHLNLPGRTDSLPFSHGVRAGDFYFVAGTLGLDSATGKPPAEPEAEARAMLDDFRARLALAGLTMDDLVSVTVYCSDLALYEGFDKLYASYFSNGRFPAFAFIGSGPLLRGCRFEIQGTAVRPLRPPTAGRDF